MKLYFMVALVIAAVHMGLASFLKSQIYQCPGSRGAIHCPHDDLSRCALYCAILDIPDQNAPVSFGFLCYNTNPPMLCRSTEVAFCQRYCQGAARATSLPIAGQQDRNPNV